MIIYVTGGVRSGKSRFAQELALQHSRQPIYVATAKVGDEDFALRVKRHQQERGSEWTTFESHRNIYALPIKDETVVIDCVTLWLTNYYMEHGFDIDKSLQDFKAEIDRLKTLNGTFIIISNELGMGLHADTDIGRKFTDLQGWANQYVASLADEVIFMVSGIPLYLKRK